MMAINAYHWSVTDQPSRRHRHDVHLSGPPPRSTETWHFQHAEAVVSSNHPASGGGRMDVVDLPAVLVGRSGMTEILLPASLERSRAGAMTTVDLRAGLDPRNEVVDLRRLFAIPAAPIASGGTVVVHRDESRTAIAVDGATYRIGKAT
jgi:hypothetical protein